VCEVEKRWDDGDDLTQAEHLLDQELGDLVQKGNSDSDDIKRSGTHGLFTVHSSWFTEAPREKFRLPS
jgi:hypothetical protein